MKNKKTIVIFLAITFLFSWIFFSIPIAFKNQDVQMHQIIITVSFALAMWGPGIGAIVATLITGGSFRDLNLGRLGPKRYLIWAWLLFPILSLATGLVTLLLGFGHFDANLTLINEAFSALPEGTGLTPALLGFNQSLGGTLASVSGWIALAIFVGWLVATRRVPVGGEKMLMPEEVD